MMMIRTYSELIKKTSYEERFKYLKLDGLIGAETFGHDRYINQIFYSSDEWKKIRNACIERDNGCDLAMEGLSISKKSILVVHHMNPITVKDILNRNPLAYDIEYMVCVTDATHKAIHYGNENLLLMEHQERTPFDTCPWKKSGGIINGKQL